MPLPEVVRVAYPPAGGRSCWLPSCRRSFVLATLLPEVVRVAYPLPSSTARLSLTRRWTEVSSRR